MNATIYNLKLRINTLERLIEKQSDVYIRGYTQALKDSNILLSDIDIEDLDAKYRAEIYEKALATFKKPKASNDII